ncbi:acyltransferase [Luteimonas yindakuii]|uniref:LpxL/LpxP family acyltransferase n=1 Tax=Luteimonas yindakuii TaxID=2565782 RepID=UPI00110772A0|nr:acyltransferase [Luteimonas yindakuii]QCU72757.1 acyltransferase [Luteimonas yindakuii]
MSAQWKWRREAGARWAVAAISVIGRYGGRGFARAVLYPVSLYFMWRRPEERRDSRAYLSRLHGRPATTGEVFRHIHTFSQTILDRLFLLSEDMRRFDVRTHGLDALHRHIDGGRGVLLFGSHLGSFEVLRVLSRQRPDVPIRVVLDRAHSASVTALLEQINPEIAATVIDAGQDGPAIMLAIQEAAAQGAMIALLADRAQPGEPSASVPFLGAPARFPMAPWLIAAVLKIPVVLAFGLYRGGNRYDLVFESFSDGIQLARRERATALPALITRYAAQLEDRVRDAPYNWFNFYDFWERGDDGVDPSAEEAGPVHAPGPASAGMGGDRAVRAAAVLGPRAAGGD